MATYMIHESNLERLEKKLATIQKKCIVSHCTFKYEITGEEFRTAVDDQGQEYTAKYYQVEVEGSSKYNGWRFIATIDHHDEGNVIRAYDTKIEVPDRYKTCGPTCEHCNKIRSRKDTYLIYNDEKNEFKQVGKACLQEFTNGLSAEDVAFFCSIYEKMEQGYGYSGPNFNRYIDVEAILRYAFECYKHWGYQKSRNSLADEEGFVPAGYRSTRERATDYYYINRALPKMKEEFQKEMDEVGFNPNSEYAVESTKAALEWIRNEKDLNSEYIRNLHVICSDEYTDYRSLGILVSLTVAYARHTEQIAAYEKKQKEQEQEKKASEHVGQVGSRINFNVASFECKSSWCSQFGVTYLYKFTDENENVFIWYESKPVDDEDRVVAITGTVKEHSEYNGLKQTVLTRCKVTLGPKKEDLEDHHRGTGEVQKALDDFFEYVNS